MTVWDFLEKIESSDRLRIMQNGEQVFVGYCALLKMDKTKVEEIGNKEVEKIRAIPEICHKNWRERNLMQPLKPNETPDFSFSDLQMTLYYTILI